jgi:hypothetical protein
MKPLTAKKSAPRSSRGLRQQAETGAFFRPRCAKRGSDGRNLDSRSGIVNDDDDTAGRLRMTVTKNHQCDIFGHLIALDHQTFVIIETDSCMHR